MTVLVKGKKQFIHALSAALDSPYDTQIELAHNGAFMQIKGTESIKRDRLLVVKRHDEMIKEWGRARCGDERATIRDMNKRLTNPQAIINRFKKTPAAMWGGK